MKNQKQNKISKWIGAAFALSLSLILLPCTSSGSQELTQSMTAGPSLDRVVLKRLARSGDASAQYELGRRYEFGIDLSMNPHTAAHWYRLAAAQGLARAEYSLGRLYFSGDGVRQDQKEAVKYFRMAAAQGYALAQHRLARAYELGQGVGQDLMEACRWYSIAATENGLESSRVNLEALLGSTNAIEIARDSHKAN